MLDPRVRSTILAFSRGQRDLESAAQVLAQVRRELGCLELHPSSAAGPAERALLVRFAELVADDDRGDASRDQPGV